MKRRDKPGDTVSVGKPLALAATIAVIAAVVAAVWLIDPPSTVRAHRLDTFRTRDLDELAIKIDCYWTLEGRLPADQDALAEITKDVVGQRPLSRTCRRALPTDPETGQRYAYRVLEAKAFELCATFSAPSPEDAAPRAWRTRNRDWRHGAGRKCFRLAPVKIEKF